MVSDELLPGQKKWRTLFMLAMDSAPRDKTFGTSGVVLRPPEVPPPLPRKYILLILAHFNLALVQAAKNKCFRGGLPYFYGKIFIGIFQPPNHRPTVDTYRTCTMKSF